MAQRQTRAISDRTVKLGTFNQRFSARAPPALQTQVTTANQFPMTPTQTGSLRISTEMFGWISEGTAIDRYLLRNSSGMEVAILAYGGILASLKVPDRHGDFADAVLGFDTLEEYVASTRYFGVIAGRYANRIANGVFELDGAQIALGTNRGGHHLHGGFNGFDTVVWSGKEICEAASVGVELNYLSKDGEQGYPGNLQATVTYRLTENNELTIDYVATTDKPTIVNLTNHAYFNLAGSGNILGHELTIEADHFTPVDATLIPTGELRKVNNTAFDFTKAHLISDGLGVADEQLAVAEGYDHNFVLRKPAGEWGTAVKLYHPCSGRALEILTTQPGLQFYSGNYIEGIKGKGGVAYQKHAGCCLETQHFPDSPNHASFPSTVLRPGERYHEKTLLRFYAVPE